MPTHIGIGSIGDKSVHKTGHDMVTMVAEYVTAFTNSMQITQQFVLTSTKWQHTLRKKQKLIRIPKETKVHL
jgi:hypothetical protein